MPAYWSTEEIAELKRLLATCEDRDTLLMWVRKLRPSVVRESALKACVQRITGRTVAQHLDDRKRTPAVFRPAPSPPEPDIPIAVDLSELPPEAQTRFELKIRTQQQRIEQLEAAKKNLLNQLHERDIHLETLTHLGSAQPTPIVAPRGRGEDKQRIATPVMLISDLHVEEPVHPEQVNGLNEYNLDIADLVIDRCADGFEWLTRDPRFDMREAVIWLGGDLYSGYIHAELQESNFLSPVEACVWLQERIGKMLRRILAETSFERIVVVCNDGNHGRLTQKMRVSTRTANSLEWLLYQTIAKQFIGEPRLVFQIAGGEWNFLDIFDHTIGFFHGDSVRYQGGVGGLLIPMRKALNEMRKYRKVDSFCAGHFHQYMALPEITTNGSGIGLGPYSMSIKATPEPRQQAFFLVDSVRGKCNQTPIWLT